MVALGIGTAGSDGELLPLSLDVGATAGHPKSAEAPVLVSPAQLPAGTRHFVGRAAELVALTDLLEEARAAGVAVTAVIGGTAGVGKTALAVHWARLSAGRFPGGQLYVNLRGFDPSGIPVAAADAIRGFLDALVPSGQIPTTAQAQAGLYRSLLAERSMFIVLDNARDAAQVRELLPGSASCMVVVTSRSQLTGLIAADGACPLQLGVLSHADAGELLARRLGRDRLAAEPQAAQELVGLCGGLPLGLAIVAARAAASRALTLERLTAELRVAARRLDAMQTGEPATSLRAVFSWSYQDLSGPAARMFRLLGVHPGPDITAPAAASLAGLGEGNTGRALAELASVNLISEQAPGRYSLHDLLRAYAAEQARVIESDTERAAASHRIFDHYLHAASAASRMLAPYRDQISIPLPSPQLQLAEFAGRREAQDWFEAERLVLLAVIGQAANGSTGAHAWQLPWAAAVFFGRRGYLAEAVAIQQSALASARQQGDRAGQAQAHRYLGQALLRLGDADAGSHLTDALELFQQIGDAAGQARAHLASRTSLMREAAAGTHSTICNGHCGCTASRGTGRGRRAPSTRSAGVTPSSAAIRRPSATANRPLSCTGSWATSAASPSRWTASATPTTTLATMPRR